MSEERTLDRCNGNGSSAAATAATQTEPGGKTRKLARLRDPYRLWYRLRGMMFVPLAVFMLFCPYPWGAHDAVIWPVGGALFLVGFWVRVWAQMHLHYRLEIRKTLTVTGPYRRVRNPIYIGNTFLLLGLSVMSGVMWSVPLVLAWCAFVYPRVVAYEEGHLLKKYGAPYRQFLQAVPRWRPLFRAPAPAHDPDTRRFLVPSLVVESSCLLMVVPFVVKELVLHA